MTTQKVEIIVTTKGAVVVKKELGDVGKQAKQSATGVDMLNRALGLLGATLGAGQLLRYADTFTNIQNRLKIVTNGTEQLTAATDELYRISQSTFSSFEGVSTIFARTATATKELGYSTKDALRFTEQLSKATALSGVSAESANAALVQLSQGLASGTLRGEELNSVMEQLPYAAQTLAKGLGVSVGALREMGQAGELTPKMIIDAFNKMTTSIDADFAKLTPTVSMGLQTIENGFIRLIGLLESNVGAFGLIAQGLTFIGNNMEYVTLALTPLAIGLTFLAAQALYAAGSAGLTALYVSLGSLYTGLVTATTAVVSFTAAMASGAVVGAVSAWSAQMTIARNTLAAFVVVAHTQVIPALRNITLATVSGVIPAFAAKAKLLVSTTIPALIATARAMLTGLIPAMTRTAAVTSGSLIPALVASVKAMLASSKAMLTGLIPATLRLAKALAVNLVTGLTAAVIAFGKLSLALIANPFTIAIAGAAALTYALYGLIYGFEEADKQVALFVDNGKRKIAELVDGIKTATNELFGLKNALAGVDGKKFEFDATKAVTDLKNVGDEISKKLSDGITTAGEKTGRGWGTALDKANANGANSMRNAFSEGGSTAATSIGNSIVSSGRNAASAIGDAIRSAYNTANNGPTSSEINRFRDSRTSELNPFGFAKGGQFMVGGSGGTDSQEVKFRASPNERVTVETPAQRKQNDALRAAGAAASSASPAAASPNINNVVVLDPNSMVDVMNTKAGSQVFMQFVELNRDEVRRKLGVK